MAGVGFELKKIIDKDGYFANSRAYFLSSIITVGPMIISIVLFLIMQMILREFGEKYINIQVYNGIIIYSFFISFICTNGLGLLISRYISDSIYKKECDNIFESFIGVIIISSLFITLGVLIILYKSPLSLLIKLSMTLIALNQGIIWIGIVFLSAVKEYIKVVVTFIIGILIVIIGTCLSVKIFENNVFNSALIFTLIGYGIISLSFIVALYKTFGIKELSLERCFKFFVECDKYYELLFIGIFLALGVYSHNIFLWFSDKAIITEDTFRSAPFYDVPSFYALLSVVASTVIFTVRVETNIYPPYKQFYNYISRTGSIEEIKKSKENLVETIVFNMKTMIEIQCIVSFIFIILGINFLPKMGFADTSLEIYSILTIGALSYITMYFLVIILLYFDARKEALKITASFFFITTLVLFLIMLTNSNQYGYGFFLGSLISTVLAFNEVNKFMRNLEYKSYSSQPLFAFENKGGFKKIYDLLFKIK